MKSILIVTPVHTKLNEYTLKSIYDLNVPKGYKIDHYMPRWGYTTLDNKGNIDPLGRENLKEKQNRARDIVLNNNYDYLLFIEEDLIIPPDAIHLLLACNSDVAYSLYPFRRYPFMLSCWLGTNENEIYGYPLDLFSNVMKDNWNNILDCDGVGFGCTLIHRSVLETLSFRIGWNDKEGDIPHSDTWFAVDCIKHNYTQRINMQCKCGHINVIEGKSVIMYPHKEDKVEIIPFIDYVTALES